MKFSLYFLSLQVGLCFSFLLDTSTKSTILGQSSLTDRHFVTVIELLSEEKQLRHQLEQFVTQLQQEVIGLKKQINSKTDNKTIIDIEISDLKLQITELKRNNQNLTNTISVLNNTLQYALSAQTTELINLKNQSYVLNNQLNELQGLQSIHQLQDLQNMQSDIKTLNSKTDALRSQELARQQDLVAMYNEIKTSKNELGSFQAFTNQSLTNLHFNTEVSLEKLDQKFNMTLDSRLLQTLDNEKHKVAFTACGARIAGSIVKFPDIKTFVGVNLSSFMTTGKFTCEFAGLYQISVAIMSVDSDVEFIISKNDQSIVHTYMPRQNSGYHTSTGVAVFELNVHDRIHIDTANSLRSVYGRHSCLTIVKVH